MKSRGRIVRLYAVGVAFFLMAAVLWVRLVQIQYIDRDHYRSVAREQMVVEEKIQPARGCIFDRHGRPLALNVRRQSVYLHPHEVTEPNRVASTIARELKISKREVRQKLRSNATFVWLKRQCELSESTKENLTSLRGVGVRLERSRVYPYGAVAAKIVGLVDVDNRGRAGAEASFEEELRGVAGSAKVLKNGQYESDRYYRFVQQKPKDGNDLYLTIDMAVQEVAEVRLQRAIAEHGARSGLIVVMQVETGDILALAESPSPNSRTGSQRADSLWTVRSLSHIYEPGSTFKLVTAAALIDLRRVSRADSYDAESGRADMGVAVIKDPHPYEIISFEEAFAYSSNIVMYKASDSIKSGEFYKYIRLFGFGERTGIELLGESPGRIARSEDWSLRSKGTIAFGQEIAVTPLQMISAYAVAANEGEMVLPRLVRATVDNESRAIVKRKPVKVRRVVRTSTANALMDFCRRTVIDGTGVRAGVDFMDVSGKTGTAQKASRRGGYTPGKYVSTFIGFAPHDDPRVVCLVLLDEPQYRSRYGGESAAPVFASMCGDIANASDVFDGALASTTISPPTRRDEGYRAPNFIRMERSAALERARKLGCNVLCQGDDGRVVSQLPGPGAEMDKDAVIRLVVTDGSSVAQRRAVTPDLRGLPVRKAKALAARHGLKCTLVGSGIVKSQTPEPGRHSGRQVVTLYCDAGGSGKNPSGGGSP